MKTKNGSHSFDVGPDTWSRTNLGALKAGQTVNMEPSLRLGDEIGGHFVSGHVDAAADVASLEPWGGPSVTARGRSTSSPHGSVEGFWRLRVKLPKILRGLVAVKGSIAVDGISLTVTAAGADDFEVMLVPHTLQNTNLGRLLPGGARKGRFPASGLGRRVNLEADPFARYAMTAILALRSTK